MNHLQTNKNFDPLYLEAFKDYHKFEIELDKEIVNDGGLHSFIKLAWPIIEPSDFIDNWHIKLLSEELEAISRGENRKLAVSVPPGSTKTLLCGVFWQAWDWIQCPSRKIIYATYNQPLAFLSARKLKDLIDSFWFQARWGDKVSLPKDRAKQISFFETSAGGFRFSSSVKGEATGRHADFIIGDDLNKAQDAFGSRLAFETSWETWSKVLPTRATSKKRLARVLIGQRLHEEDVVGRWLNKDPSVKYICLPLRFEQNHPFLYYKDPREEEGELICDEVYDEEVVKDLEDTLGTIVATAQLQQRPSNPEGNIVKEEWLCNYWKRLNLSKGFYKFWSWDLSFKDTKDSSWNVGQLWAYHFETKNFHLIHLIREKMDFPTAKKQISESYAKFQCPVLIEDKANGPAIIAELRKGRVEVKPGIFVRPEIIEIQPKGTKFARLNSVCPILEEGRVLLPYPEGAVLVEQEHIHPHWLPEFKKELTRFSGSDSDKADQVDSFSQALSYIRDKFELAGSYMEKLENLSKILRNR